MKKFFAILIAFACVFSLFSCGDNEDPPTPPADLSNFEKAMDNTVPSLVNLSVTVTTKFGELSSSYVTTYNADGSFAVAYSIEEFAPIGDMSTDELTVVKTGTVSCDQNGNYSDGGTISGTIASQAGNRISIKEELMEFSYSADENILTAKVLAANTEAVFGVALNDVTLVMTKLNDKIVSYTMTYDRTSGSDVNHVVVACEFK